MGEQMTNMFKRLLVISILTIIALPLIAFGDNSTQGIATTEGDLKKNESATTTDISVEEKEEGGNAIGYTDEEIAEMINNPLGHLWMMFTQNDTVWYSGDVLDAFGEDSKVFNTTLLNPVMPFQLTENWKWIFRPVIPINSFDLPSGISSADIVDQQIDLDFDRETGLGDIVLFNAFSTNEGAAPPNVWGVGFTAMLDTASDDRLGFGKWSAGPVGIGMHISDKWIIGGIVQHFWSFAGDDDRDDVNLTDFQYIIRYRLSPETNIGIAPNIRYDWDAESGERLSLPVGLGVDTLTSIGPLPVKIGIEGYYYVERPDAFGPEWQIRLLFVPVLPSPSWAKIPLFGK